MKKQIYDPIHGFIEFTSLQVKIIDTSEFQRLRDLKQLGATYYVFPGATHTRFEHSLGVCHLAMVTMKSLAKNQPELKITERDIEITGVAGLIHDLGHGPFSHLYDTYVKNPKEPEHEIRGCEIFKTMVSKYELPLSHHEINRIQKMIIPIEKDNWRYQIVANALNQIDVDKIDYIQRDCHHIGFPCGGEFSRILTQCRVIDDTLCFPKKTQLDILTLFMTRYRLHKQVYNHPTVKGYEFLIIEILKSYSNYNFLDLTDTVVTCRLHTTEQQRKQQQKIWRREHWILVYETGGDLVLNNFSDPNVRIERHRIGFVTGNKPNPLNSVWVFGSPDKKEKLDLGQKLGIFDT